MAAVSTLYGVTNSFDPYELNEFYQTTSAKKALAEAKARGKRWRPVEVVVRILGRSRRITSRRGSSR